MSRKLSFQNKPNIWAKNLNKNSEMNLKKNLEKNMAFSKNFGFSLVELMVALTIGLFVSMAVYSVVSVSESRKRTTTTKNDIDQAGAYAMYQIDQALRNAGAGLGEEAAFGCPLRAANKNVQVLPATTFLDPFGAVDKNLRLVPALILEDKAGDGGDIILSMSGAGGLAEVATPFAASGSSNTVMSLKNVVGFSKNDITLLVESTTKPCFISQVDSTFEPTVSATNVPLAGDYYSANISGNPITDANTFALNIGKSPNFTMLGIGANNTLFTYNLLLKAEPSTNPTVFIENTYQLKAIYGVTNTANSTDITWVKPRGDYLYSKLMADPARLASIRAIKVALILRTDLKEKETVSAKTMTVFADTNIPIEIKLDAQNYRYQAFETTVPLRNSLIEGVN